MATALYTRREVIGALAGIRKDWQETGADLIEARGSVGLILADLARSLALDPKEQRAVFGGKSFKQLQQAGIIDGSEHAEDWQPEQ
jgi:hypothetical protein